MSKVTKDTGIVEIHGKQYSTVAKRVQDFRQEHKLEYSIETELVESNGAIVVMKAIIRDKTNFVIATGYAEENRASSQINKTSALENCETSAIGRALAAFGLAGIEYASADEVAQAIHQQTTPKPKWQPSKINPINENQKMTMANLLRQRRIEEKDDIIEFLTGQYGLELRNGEVQMTEADAELILSDLDTKGQTR